MSCLLLLLLLSCSPGQATAKLRGAEAERRANDGQNSGEGGGGGDYGVYCPCSIILELASHSKYTPLLFRTKFDVLSPVASQRRVVSRPVPLHRAESGVGGPGAPRAFTPSRQRGSAAAVIVAGRLLKGMCRKLASFLLIPRTFTRRGR